jgi:hypothetical protein
MQANWRECFSSRQCMSESELPANLTRHRIAARLRFGMNVKGHVWAARGALGR